MVGHGLQRNWQIELLEVNSLILLRFPQQKKKLDPYNPQKGVSSLSAPMNCFNKSVSTQTWEVGYSVSSLCTAVFNHLNTSLNLVRCARLFVQAIALKSHHESFILPSSCRVQLTSDWACIDRCPGLKMQQSVGKLLATQFASWVEVVFNGHASDKLRSVMIYTETSWIWLGQWTTVWTSLSVLIIIHSCSLLSE